MLELVEWLQPLEVPQVPQDPPLLPARADGAGWHIPSARILLAAACGLWEGAEWHIPAETCKAEVF